MIHKIGSSVSRTGARWHPVPVMGALVAILVGCAPLDSAPVGQTSSPSPTPTVACPQVEGQELPPECAPYDPDQAMQQNERYRDRMELTGDSLSATQAAVGPIRAALENVRVSGDISVDAVQSALADMGFDDVQVRDDYGTVLFGVSIPDGACAFGEVTAGVIEVEAGGYIMDGGCLPSQ